MLQEFLSAWAFGFITVFARAGALVMLLPGFADPGPPARVRLGFALLLALVLTPIAAPALPPPPTQTAALGMIIGGEVMIGLAIGLVIRMFTAALATAGQIIATQTGMAMAMAFDPTQNQQGSVFGSFLNLCGVALIFAADIHHGFLRGLAASYGVFTPGAVFSAGDFAALSVATFAQTFTIALQVSAPFLVFGLAFNLGLGVLARLMPQLQVFFVAMPANVLLGLILFAAAMGGGLIMWREALAAFVDGLA